MIEINNLTTVSVNEEFLKKVAQKVLTGEKVKEELSIALIGEARMRKLNKKYRGKNRITDVLAFGQNQKSFESFLGEVIICLKAVKKNAKRFKEDLERELARVLIHGILHLLGYNHEKSEKEAKEMEKKEDYYLSQIQ